MPSLSYDKESYKKQKEEELKALNQQVKEIAQGYETNPEELAQLAQFSARFYLYSIRNQILIQNQNPSAVFVGSFGKWKELGYSVKKQKHGIKILVPTPVTLFRESEDKEWKSLSQATHEEKQNLKTNSYETRKITHFKIGTVFEISQTTCSSSDYPKIFSMGFSSEQHQEIYNGLVSYCENSMGCPVSVEDINSISLRGYYSPEQHQISLNNKLEDTQKVSTLTHEMGHALMHQNVESGTPASQLELEADILSVMLQSHFSVEITDSRKSHLAGHYRAYQQYVQEKKEEEDCPSLLQCFQKANDVYRDNVEKIDQEIQKCLERKKKFQSEISTEKPEQSKAPSQKEKENFDLDHIASIQQKKEKTPSSLSKKNRDFER